MQIFRLATACMKIIKFLMSLFKPPLNFSLNIESPFSVMTHNSSITFLSQTLHALLKRSPLKFNFWGLSIESKFSKFLMSSFKAQVSSSSNCASFFIVMTHNSSAIFRLKYNILSTKISHWSANSQTCHCSH